MNGNLLVPIGNGGFVDFNFKFKLTIQELEGWESNQNYKKKNDRFYLFKKNDKIIVRKIKIYVKLIG